MRCFRAFQLSEKEFPCTKKKNGSQTT